MTCDITGILKDLDYGVTVLQDDFLKKKTIVVSRDVAIQLHDKLIAKKIEANKDYSDEGMHFKDD
ncbi:MAG: hypothetical protein WC449_06240 [Candidatus Paceibacterota bacterium]